MEIIIYSPKIFSLGQITIAACNLSQLACTSALSKLMKMEPCFSRRTVILIWLGFTLFFFTVQMIIVYVALNADADKAIGVVVSNKPKSTARFLHERLIRTIRDKGESGLESNPCLIERL